MNNILFLLDKYTEYVLTLPKWAEFVTFKQYLGMVKGAMNGS